MSNYRRRTVAVLVLAALGVVLAWVGTATGVGSVVAGGEPTGEINVAGDDVTVEGANGKVTVIENVTASDAIEIAAENGGITIRTEDRDPLTAEQRERARGIVKSNDTLRKSLKNNYLGSVDEFEFSVEPVRKLRTEDATQYDVDADPSGNGQDTFTITNVENVTVQQNSDSVTIESAQPDPNYVEDRAVVRISDPETGETLYSVEVDLARGRVVGVTDWTES